jgi:hypothetical protein
VAFDQAMNLFFRDCVELYHPPYSVHPQKGCYTTEPFVFRGAEIVSMTIEALLSLPPMLVVSMLATVGPNAPPRGSVAVPPLALSLYLVSWQPTSPTDWVADSDASYHTTPDPCIISLPHPHKTTFPSSIIVGNGSTLPVTSTGDTVLPGPLYVNKILVAPNIIYNLISVCRFTTNNYYSMGFDHRGLTIHHLTTRALVAQCDRSDPLHSICFPAPPPSSCVATSYALASTWHRRLGTPSTMSFLDSRPPRPFSAPAQRCLPLPCLSAWSPHSLTLTSSMSRTARPFDLIHYDLWTSLMPSLSGDQYYLVIRDDFSHYLWTFFLRRKSNTFPTLSHFFAWVLTQFGCPIRGVPCDNGREFDNSTSRAFFILHDVQLWMSCPYTSTQNGKAERMNRTITNLICTLLF